MADSNLTDLRFRPLDGLRAMQRFVLDVKDDTRSGCECRDPSRGSLDGSRVAEARAGLEPRHVSLLHRVGVLPKRETRQRVRLVAKRNTPIGGAVDERNGRVACVSVGARRDVVDLLAKVSRGRKVLPPRG